eukprot:TRINITY_DN47503_c0_g1_i1.p1 TRINITY_DN47503_c0_g1~~TRINITY_DN47503_c0_g1_i1.p1  ORF type:complete len:280 (+),score=103.43 TRINITY_DN47503_c0_g1_i1:85-840(+)
MAGAGNALAAGGGAPPAAAAAAPPKAEELLLRGDVDYEPRRQAWAAAHEVRSELEDRRVLAAERRLREESLLAQDGAVQWPDWALEDCRRLAKQKVSERLPEYDLPQPEEWEPMPDQQAVLAAAEQQQQDPCGDWLERVRSAMSDMKRAMSRWQRDRDSATRSDVLAQREGLKQLLDEFSRRAYGDVGGIRTEGQGRVRQAQLHAQAVLQEVQELVKSMYAHTGHVAALQGGSSPAAAAKRPRSESPPRQR